MNIFDYNKQYLDLKSDLSRCYNSPIGDTEKINHIANKIIQVEYVLSGQKPRNMIH